MWSKYEFDPPFNLPIGITITGADGKMIVREKMKLASLELDEIPPRRSYFVRRVKMVHDEILKRKMNTFK